MRLFRTLIYLNLLFTYHGAAHSQDDFGRERRLDSVPKEIEPSKLTSVNDKPWFTSCTHMGGSALFPKVRSRASWALRVRTPYDSAIEWSVEAYGPDGLQRFPACEIENGFVMPTTATVPEIERLDRIRFIPEGDASAQEWTFELKGSEAQTWNRIGWLVISDDGNHIGYAGQKGLKWQVVVDGRVGGEYEQVSPLVFGPGGVFAYTGRYNSQWRVVVNGNEQEEGYDEVLWPTFSSSGKSFAFAARKGDSWHVITNGKAGPGFSAVEIPIFRPRNDNSLAYIAHKSDEVMVIVDGKPQKSYNQVRWLAFSPNGKRLAYAAWKDGEAYVVVDGEKEADFAAVDMPVFSADGKSFAYAAQAGDKWGMLRDKQRGELFEKVGRPLFSKKGTLAYAAMKGGRWLVAVGPKTISSFEWVGGMRFDETGAKLGFAALIGDGMWWKVVEIEK
jgi:WD40-like Beta Propeller Repeat